jgi:hypothetical protein
MVVHCHHQRDDADDEGFSPLVSLHRKHADGSQWSGEISTINGTMLMMMDFRLLFHSIVNTPMVHDGVANYQPSTGQC